jgi:hypothetical protein
MNDEFYIGWEVKAAPGIRKTVQRVVIILFLIAFLAPLGLAVSQRMIGASVFEWGEVKHFAGILQATPYPRLLVPRPGRAVAGSFSTDYLVAPFKFGLDPGAIAPLDGKSVALEGTLIYRGNQTMIEVAKNSLQLDKTNSVPAVLPGVIPLGKQTLVGEIVDSKCYLGVMNPGQLTPHRACAIRCISGGVPPVLLVRQKHGPPIYLLLVATDGRPVNQQVLNLVAEPVQIAGEVERQGELLILRADPATYRKL